jgi:hypothetical protein
MSRSRKQKANGGNPEATNQQVDRDQILFAVAPGVANDCGPRFVSLLNKAMKEEERRLVAYHGLAIIIVPDGSTETPPAPEALQGRKLLFIAESAIKTYENESDSLSRLKFTVLITVFGNGPVSEESWNIAKSQPMSVTVNVDGVAIQIPISNSGLSILPNALSKAVVLTAAEEVLHRMTAEGSIQSTTLPYNVKLYQTYTRFVEEEMALMKKVQTRTKNALEAEKNRILKEGMNGIRFQIVGPIPPETVVTFCNDVIKKWDKKERQLLGSKNLSIVFDSTSSDVVSSKGNQLIIGQRINEVKEPEFLLYRHQFIKFFAYLTALGTGPSIDWKSAKDAAIEYHAKGGSLERFQMHLDNLPGMENNCALLMDQVVAILASPDLERLKLQQPSIENLIDAYNQYQEFVSQQVAEMHRQPKENTKPSVADASVDLAQSGVMLGTKSTSFAQLRVPLCDIVTPYCAVVYLDMGVSSVAQALQNEGVQYNSSLFSLLPSELEDKEKVRAKIDRTLHLIDAGGYDYVFARVYYVNDGPPEQREGTPLTPNERVKLQTIASLKDCKKDDASLEELIRLCKESIAPVYEKYGPQPGEEEITKLVAYFRDHPSLLPESIDRVMQRERAPIVLSSYEFAANETLMFVPVLLLGKDIDDTLISTVMTRTLMLMQRLRDLNIDDPILKNLGPGYSKAEYALKKKNKEVTNYNQAHTDKLIFGNASSHIAQVELSRFEAITALANIHFALNNYTNPEQQRFIKNDFKNAIAFYEAGMAYIQQQIDAHYPPVLSIPPRTESLSDLYEAGMEYLRQQIKKDEHYHALPPIFPTEVSREASSKLPETPIAAIPRIIAPETIKIANATAEQKQQFNAAVGTLTAEVKRVIEKGNVQFRVNPNLDEGNTIITQNNVVAIRASAFTEQPEIVLPGYIFGYGLAIALKPAIEDELVNKAMVQHLQRTILNTEPVAAQKPLLEVLAKPEVVRLNFKGGRKIAEILAGTYIDLHAADQSRFSDLLDVRTDVYNIYLEAAYRAAQQGVMTDSPIATREEAQKPAPLSIFIPKVIPHPQYGEKVTPEHIHSFVQGCQNWEDWIKKMVADVTFVIRNDQAGKPLTSHDIALKQVHISATHIQSSLDNIPPTNAMFDAMFCVMEEDVTKNPKWRGTVLEIKKITGFQKNNPRQLSPSQILANVHDTLKKPGNLNTSRRLTPIALALYEEFMLKAKEFAEKQQLGSQNVNKVEAETPNTNLLPPDITIDPKYAKKVTQKDIDTFLAGYEKWEPWVKEFIQACGITFVMMHNRDKSTSPYDPETKVVKIDTWYSNREEYRARDQVPAKFYALFCAMHNKMPPDLKWELVKKEVIRAVGVGNSRLTNINNFLRIHEEISSNGRENAEKIYPYGLQLYDQFMEALKVEADRLSKETAKERLSANVQDATSPTPYPASEAETPDKQPELEKQPSPELKNATEEQQQRFAEAFEKVPDYAKRIIIHEEVSFTTGSHPFVEINVSNKNVTLPVTIVNNPAFKSHIFASGLVATLQPHIENKLFETALNEFLAILPSHLSSQQIERAMWKHGIEHCQATVLAHAYDQIDTVKADNSACRKILNIYQYAAEQHIANASLAIPINGSSGKDSQHTQPSIPNLPIPYVLSLEQKLAAQADSALRKEIDRLCSKLDCGLPLHQALGTAALADPVVKLAIMYHDYQGVAADKKQERILTLSDVLKENVTLEALKFAQRAWKEASNLKIGNIRDTDPLKQNKLRDNHRDLLDSLDRDCPTIYAALNGDIKRNIQEALKPAPYTHTLEFPPKANRALLAEVQNLCQNMNTYIEVDKQLGGALFKGPVSKLIVASSTGISGNISAALRDESNKNKGINEARKTAKTQLSNILASDHPLKKVLSESPIIVACVYGDKERILEALGLTDIAARRAFVAEQLLLAEEAQTSKALEKNGKADSESSSPEPKKNENIPEERDQKLEEDEGAVEAKDQKTALTTPTSTEKLPGEEADGNKGVTNKAPQKKALPPAENSEEALEGSKRIFESRLQNDPALSPEELNSRRARAYEAMSEQLSVDALYVAMTAKDNGYNQYRCDLLVDKTHARVRLFFKSDEAGKLPYSKIFDLNSMQYLEGYARLGVTPTSLDALNLQIIVNGEIAANGDFLPIFGKTTSGKPRITKDDFIPNRAINKDDRETALKVSNAGIYQLELTAQYTKNGDKVTIVFPLGVKKINGNGTEAEAAAAELIAKERMGIIEKFIDDYNPPNAKRRKIPIKREIQGHLENIVAEIRVVDPQNPNGYWATPEHIELLITDGLKKAYLGATDPAYQLLLELPKSDDRDKALKAAEDALPRVVVVDKEDDWVNWKWALTEIGYGQYRHTPVPIPSLDEIQNKPQNMMLGAMAMSKGGSNQTYHLKFTLHVNDDPVNNTSAGYLIRTRGMNLGIEDPEMARSRVQEVIFGSDKAMGLVYMLQDYFEQRPQARWLLVEKKGEGGESTKELAGNVQKEVSEVLSKEQIHLYRQMIKNELPADNMSYRLNIVREEPEYGLVTIRVQIQQKQSDDLFVIVKNTKGENLELFFAVPEKKADLVESYVRGDMDYVRLDRFVWDLIPRFEHDLSVRMDRVNPQDKDGPIPVTFSVMRGRRDGKLEPHLDTTGAPVTETRLIPQKYSDMIHSFEETVAEHLSLLAGLHYSPLMPSTPFTSSSPYVELRQEVLAAKELGPQFFIDQRHPPFNADKPKDWLAHATKSNLEVIFGSDHGIPDPVKKGSASNGNSNLKDLRELQRVSREVIDRMRSNPGDPGWRM